MSEQDIKNDLLLDDEEHIIDVATSFNCKHQDEEYNVAYKKWRADGNNSFAYNYVNDTREHAYLDGRGFIEQSPDAIEKSSLMKNMSIIGTILVISLLIQTIGKYLYIYISKFLGCDVNYDIISGLSNASDGYIILMNYVIQIFGYVFPAILLMRFLKLPPVVIFPLKVINKDMHKIAIPAIMVMFTIGNYGIMLFEKVLGVMDIKITELTFFLPKTQGLAVLSILLNLVISPIIIEFCLRGAIMQSLRQFGDDFALIITSIISALMIHNFTYSLCAFMLSLVIGYFVLRTGSLLTGIVMRIFFFSASYGVYLVRFLYTEDMVNFITSIIFFSFITIGFFIILMTIRKKRDFAFLSIQKTYITTKEKLLYSISTLPIIVWIMYVFILTLMSMSFKI